MIVYPVLSQRMKDHGMTFKELATLTDTNIITICLKMWGVKQWTLADAVTICCFFNTHDTEHLFRKVSLFKIVQNYYTTQK